MTLTDSRKFLGCSFGLSISAPPAADPSWPGYYGEPAAVIDQFVFTEGMNFLFEGGRLVLGHRWHDGSGNWDDRGVLNYLVEKSRDFRSFRPATPAPDTGEIPAAILNFLAWPDAPPTAAVPEAQRLVAEGILSIQQILPPAIAPALLANPPPPLQQYARIRALTAMRQRLVAETDFRICIGGAFGKNERRLPGIIEEALLTCAAGKPLYVSDAFGGASKALAECLLQRRVKFGEEETFYTPPETASLMAAHAQNHPWPSDLEGPSTREGWNAFTWFQSQPLEDIATRAGLTLEQYCQVLAARDVESAMGWILVGIQNLIAAKK